MNLLDRRQMLGQSGMGFGLIALSALLREDGLMPIAEAAAASSAVNPLASHPPHRPAKAKSIIWLFINGGPSHVDTWDYKPALARWGGKSIREYDSSFTDTTGFFRDQVGNLMPSPFTFRRHGECGKWVSSLFPQLSQHVDKMAFVHSGYTESNNHSPALFMMNCGLPRMGFPCVGSWVTYGLGCDSQSLPAFVVMSDPLDRGLPKGHAANWGAAFLPSVYQGTWIKPKGDPIENLARPDHFTDTQQRRHLDLLNRLNQRHFQQREEELLLLEEAPGLEPDL